MTSPPPPQVWPQASASLPESSQRSTDGDTVPAEKSYPPLKAPPAAVTRPQEALLFTPEEPGSLLPGGSPALTSWAQVPSAAQRGVGPKRQLAGD